jgi:hypothetical protein
MRMVGKTGSRMRLLWPLLPLKCTFDLKDKMAGTWDVVVINPGEKEGKKTQAFTVEEEEKPEKKKEEPKPKPKPEPKP